MRAERRIFEDAIERTPEERPVFLAEACGDDGSLRQRVDRLLDAYDGLGTFLSEPTRGAGLHDDSGSGLDLDSDIGTRSESTGIEAPEERPGACIGPYRILERIGEGGFGSVFVAQQDEPIRRRVALKIVKLGMDTRQVIGRFEQERQALALMEHANIARVLDAGATDSGRPYFVMELVRGEPITAYCDRRSLSIEERLRLFLPVCHAVQHAHQKGIIHRDIKPSNVLVTERDGVPMPKVIDFGIAKATNAELADRTVYTGVRQIVGTPQYMAPEQATLSELDIDTRCDVYALGAVLYELLTGATPFDARRLRRAGYVELHRIITEEEPGRPSLRVNQTRTSEEADHVGRVARKRSTDPGALRRGLRGDLDAIAMKALEKDRTRRYQTAMALADDLERSLRCEPVLASPPTARYRIGRFVRRHRAGVGAAMIACTALAVAIGGLVWGLVEASDERDRAVAAQTSEQAARRQAELDRHAAEVSLEATEERAHAAALAAADAALERHDLGLARAMLLDTAPDRRGWAWHYLAGRLDGAERTIVGHSFGVFAIAHDPVGDRVASIGLEDGLRIFDWQTGRQVLHVKGVYANPGECMAYSPDGRFVAVVDDYEHVAIIDTENGVTTRHLELELRLFRPTTVRWSADGRRILVCDGRVHLVDAATGVVEARVEREGESAASAAMTADGRLVTAWEDGSVRMHAMPEGILQWEVEPAAPGSAGDVAIAPDGTRFAVTAADRRVRIRRVDDGALEATATGHDGTLTSVDWSRDGSILATGSVDGTARLWSPEGNELQVLAGHTDALTTVRFAPDDTHIVTASMDRTLRVWNVAPPETLEPATTVSRWLAIRPDGAIGLRVDHDRFTFAPSTLALVEPLTGAVRSTLPSADAPLVGTARFDRSGALLALGLHDGRVVVIDTSSGAVRAEIAAHEGSVTAVDFPTGTGMVISAADDGLAWWEIGTWREDRRWRSPYPITALDASADGQLLAAGDSAGGVHLVDAKEGIQQRHFPGAAYSIEDILCLPERDRIVVAALDPSVGGIPVAADGLLVVVLGMTDAVPVRELRLDTMALGDAPVALSYSPLGRGTVTVAPVAPGRLPLIDLESGRQVLALDTDYWMAVTRGAFVGREGHDLQAFGFYGRGFAWSAQDGFEVARVHAARDEARAIVGQLAEEELFLERVLPALSDMTGLDPAVAQMAAEVALDSVPPGVHFVRLLRRTLSQADAAPPTPEEQSLARSLLAYHESGSVLATVGAMRYRLGDHVVALEMLERASERSIPHDFDSFTLAFLGLARLEGGDEEGARSALDRAQAVAAAGDEENRRNVAAVITELEARLTAR